MMPHIPRFRSLCRHALSVSHGTGPVLMAVLFFCGLWLGHGPVAGAYTILAPGPEKNILVQARRPEINLILKVADDDELASIRVEQSGRHGKKDQVITAYGQWRRKDGLVVHYRLPLARGTNRYRIFPDERELSIRFRPVRTIMNVDFEKKEAFLFHRKAVIPSACSGCHSEKLPKEAQLDVQRLSRNKDFSPVCYSCHRRLIKASLWLHSPSANVQCTRCHLRKKGKTRISILTGKVETTCYQCHINKKKIKTQSHVHGPVGTGDCTVCHDPHGDRYQFQLWADGREKLCIGCHTEMKTVLIRKVGFHRHGIIQGGGCIACHDPHASSTRFQLYLPINELCTSCHVELQGITTGHPVGKHPLGGKPDPLRKNRELSCTSCHQPHGSSFRYLLIGDILGGHVCSKCHS